MLTEISINDKFKKETQLSKNKLPYETFKMLCNLDPTSQNNKVGKYANWILAKYKPNTDWGQLRTSLEWFADGARRGILKRYNINNDINSFKSYDEFISTMNTLSQSSDATISQHDYNKRNALQNQYEIIGSTSEFYIIKILTWEAERYFGSKTDWCTVANKDYFNSYSKKGPLFIFYPKNGDSAKKMQFHFQSKSFADCRDVVYSDPKSCIINTLDHNNTAIELGKKCIEIWGENDFTGYVQLMSDYSDEILFNLLNNNWELILDKWVDSITPTQLENFYKITLDGLCNIINKEGELLSKHWFNTIEYDPQSKWFEATLSDYGHLYIYPDGSFELDEPTYPELFGNVCQKLTRQGIAIVDVNGNPIIDEIINGYVYYPNMVQLKTLDKRSIFLNENGEEIDELNGFDKVDVINRSKQIFAVYKDDNFNIYDFKNHIFILKQWLNNARIDRLHAIHGRRFLIYNDKLQLYNVVDINGTFLLKHWYENCTPLYNNTVVFSSKQSKEKAILDLYDNTVQYIVSESKQPIQISITDIKKIIIETINVLLNNKKR